MKNKHFEHKFKSKNKRMNAVHIMCTHDVLMAFAEKTKSQFLKTLTIMEPPTASFNKKDK